MGWRYCEYKSSLIHFPSCLWDNLSKEKTSRSLNEGSHLAFVQGSPNRATEHPHLVFSLFGSCWSRMKLPLDFPSFVWPSPTPFATINGSPSDRHLWQVSALLSRTIPWHTRNLSHFLPWLSSEINIRLWAWGFFAICIDLIFVRCKSKTLATVVLLDFLFFISLSVSFSRVWQIWDFPTNFEITCIRWATG